MATPPKTKKVNIETINLRIGPTKLTLTMEEAGSLFEELARIFPRQYYTAPTVNFEGYAVPSSPSAVCETVTGDIIGGPVKFDNVNYGVELVPGPKEKNSGTL